MEISGWEGSFAHPIWGYPEGRTRTQKCGDFWGVGDGDDSLRAELEESEDDESDEDEDKMTERLGTKVYHSKPLEPGLEVGDACIIRDSAFDYINNFQSDNNTANTTNDSVGSPPASPASPPPPPRRGGG